MKKSLLSFLLLVFSHFAFPQTNTNVGTSAGNAGSHNTSIGYYAGRTTGAYNSFLGSNAGYYMTTGSFNAFMGYRSGVSNTSGGNNLYLGAYSGNLNSTGSRNIFIGYQAGYYETSSDKLYIENSSISSPLVYGDFAANILAINGKLGVGTHDPITLLHIDAKNTRNGLAISSESDGSVFSDIAFYPKNQSGILSGNAADWLISHRKDGAFSGSEAQTGSTLEFYGIRRGGGYFAPLVFKANGDVLLASPKLATSGNVGVGLINPTEKLQVDGNVFINKENSGIIIDAGGKKRVGLMKFSQREAGIWRISTQDFEIGRVTSATSITEGLGSTPVVDMYFSPSGNIGIGTTTPNSRLAVDGKITAREVEVTADGWADFVFEEEYDLPTLADVEEHIKVNKHLPAIPSAAEVAQNGINLGEMDALLLQKIEELTLYMIEQDKQLEALKKEVKFLQTSPNNK